jgi:DNA-binding CsgD family transcriptional regulator
MADLTDRELQLLELVALGNTNTAIARKLGISPRTVAHHLDSAYRKLDVTSRAAAVYRAVNEGLVPPKPPGPANPPTPRSKLSLGREALEHPATDDASYGHPGAVRDPLNLLDLLRGSAGSSTRPTGFAPCGPLPPTTAHPASTPTPQPRPR